MCRIEQKPERQRALSCLSSAVNRYLSVVPDLKPPRKGNLQVSKKHSREGR